jgi:hypothetical protein
MHPLRPPQPAARPRFLCDFAQYRFAFRVMLKQHRSSKDGIDLIT